VGAAGTMRKSRVRAQLLWPIKDNEGKKLHGF
jgi:hypothetical protein